MTLIDWIILAISAYVFLAGMWATAHHGQRKKIAPLERIGGRERGDDSNQIPGRDRAA